LGRDSVGGVVVRRVLPSLAGIGLCVSASFAAQAEGQPDRHALAVAQARLLAATLRAPTNFDLTFEYVRVSTALGDYEGAIGALERVLAYAPHLGRANFELATLYFRLGSYDNAVHYFKAAAAAPDLDPKLRARLTAYLPEAQKQLSPVRWSGFLQTGLGYQSNVAALPDTGFVSIFGQSAPQGSGVAQRADGEVFGLAKISNIVDLENQRGDRIETNFIGYGTGEFSLHQFDLGYTEASIGPRLALDPVHWPGVTIKPYIVGNLSWVGGSSYLNSGGAGVSLGVDTAADWSVSPDFEWRRLSVNNPGPVQITALGSGDYLSFSVAGTYRFTDFISVQVQPIYARAIADNEWQSFNQGGFQAGLHVEFDAPFPLIPLQWTVMPYVSALWDSFDAPDPAVNASIRRCDFAYYGGVLLDMPITANFGLSGMAQYARTNSNLPNFTNDDVTILFGPTARF
jgi:Tetratricopeptide repeat